MTQYRQIAHIIAFAACILVLAVVLALDGCSEASVPSGQDTSSSQNASAAISLAGTYEQVDMNGYECLQNREQAQAAYYNVTVLDVEHEMEQGSTFVLYVGFEKCPWCNVVLPFLNDAATQRNIPVLYLDTRAKPEWMTNMDIDNYDTFVELFGNYLRDDDEGKKHLYVPHIFFVKGGKVVGDHAGTVEGQDEPTDPLTQEQQDELQRALDESFALIGV